MNLTNITLENFTLFSMSNVLTYKSNMSISDIVITAVKLGSINGKNPLIITSNHRYLSIYITNMLISACNSSNYTYKFIYIYISVIRQ